LRYHLALLLALICAVSLAGCGDPDRSALAKQAVVTYWSDINHGKFNAAFEMLTSGERGVLTFSSYRQSMFGFLTHVSGVTVTPGDPQVTDDRATVPVGFHSPAAPGTAHFFQHLFWENGGWKIADQNGGVSPTK
jgi:hypothetical protein